MLRFIFLILFLLQTQVLYADNKWMNLAEEIEKSYDKKDYEEAYDKLENNKDFIEKNRPINNFFYETMLVKIFVKQNLIDDAKVIVNTLNDRDDSFAKKKAEDLQKFIEKNKPIKMTILKDLKEQTYDLGFQYLFVFFSVFWAVKMLSFQSDCKFMQNLKIIRKKKLNIFEYFIDSFKNHTGCLFVNIISFIGLICLFTFVSLMLIDYFVYDAILDKYLSYSFFGSIAFTCYLFYLLKNNNFKTTRDFQIASLLQELYYTGEHMELYEALKWIKQDYQDIEVERFIDLVVSQDAKEDIRKILEKL